LASVATTAALQSDVPIFHLVRIKPTHYDHDGYPIQWVKAAIPSNTLACLNGLAEDTSRALLVSLSPGKGDFEWSRCSARSVDLQRSRRRATMDSTGSISIGEGALARKRREDALRTGVGKVPSIAIAD
jgi:hypothetical protein